MRLLGAIVHLPFSLNTSYLRRSRLSVVGCSVSIRIRPPARSRSENKLFSEILVDLLNENDGNWELFNNSRSRLLSTELIDYRDTLASQNPDILILNIGAVDAPNREIPKWYSDVLFRRKWLNLYGVASKFYHALIRRFLRNPLVYVRMKTPWVGIRKFEKSYTEFLKFVEKDLKSRVIILGINPGSERIENELPGSLDRYRQYNEKLRSIAERFDCDYVDMSELSAEDYFPDGVHYNAEGHRWCAEQLFRIIGQKEPSSRSDAAQKREF